MLLKTEDILVVKIIRKMAKYINDPIFRFNVNSILGFYDNVSDEEYLNRQYFLYTGEKLNLQNPKGFNEKMQWLKLYNRKPVFTIMVDKHAVKEYLTPIIGAEHIVPLLATWIHVDEIDINSLPSQFVLKTTHGCGGMYICRDKEQFDINKAKKGLNKSLKKSYFAHSREWPYKNVVPKIIAEKYLQDGNTLNLNVYKIFNFSGTPYLIQTIQNDKTAEETIDYFDTEWNLLELKQNYPNSKHPLPKPKTLDKMLELSKKCSKGIPFIRTDWYEVNGVVFFSEFTFFSDAGMAPFYPTEWDKKLGDMIDLTLCD